jgi:adenosylcobinamide-phosphate synthase
MIAFPHSAWLVSVCAVVVALLLDRCWGEPPEPWHPVVWIGRYLHKMGTRIAPVATHVRSSPDVQAFVLGFGAWLVGALLVTLLAVALTQAIQDALPVGLKCVVLGVLLKPMFSWSMLEREVLAVESALRDSLQAGRARLSYLCSRETGELQAAAVRETAIESLAENLNDSVIAPLFWFALLGLPGAVLYRYANTADAMWGYRGQRQGRTWEWAGKWAARADDVLSWVPARITALAMLVLARGRVTLGHLWREARKTPSPNGGWPMAAMALALNVRLHKPGVYELNPAGRLPEPQDTLSAVSLSRWAGGLGLLMPWMLAVAWIGWRSAW